MAKKQDSEGVVTSEIQGDIMEGQEDTSNKDGNAVSSDATVWVQKMNQVPLANIRGAGSTQENRCIPEAIKVVVGATESLYGIHESTALTAISEMIRRGGANASTPGTFSV